ncbi:MAG TPA: hypothetical protein EYG00_14560 [Alcanivorax sp.]|nr:hypothetical protein [Alcanivorax sp.]
MQLKDILVSYPQEGLDQLARDKLDDIANVRLPRAVVEQEIANALSSFSYIAEVLAGSQPPAYAFLKLLMEAPDHTVLAEGYREDVIKRTDELTRWVASGEGLAAGKSYDLYRALLQAAWEDDGRINASEAYLLEALRNRLGLSMREQLLLEHHPDIRPLWESARVYESARNYLLARGLVLTVQDRYVLADEVRLQIRRYWGMELHDSDYRTLLGQLTGSDLRRVLEASGLPLSGSKEERQERLVSGLVAPSFALDCLSGNELKELTRSLGLPTSLSKAELITQLIARFDSPDLQQAHSNGTNADQPRMLDDDSLHTLLLRLSGNQLYEILAGLGLPRSGTKSDRARQLVTSSYSELAMLDQLRGRELARLCRKQGLPVSGLKDELIERLVTAPPRDSESEEDEIAMLKVPAPDEHSAAPAEPFEPAVEPRGSCEQPSNNASVKGTDEIVARYPGLRPDQNIILALLREARSLNERDIQRLATRHELGWMLPKAHMAELLRTLEGHGDSPVRVRSTGSANIYEWVEDASNAEKLDRWAARDVIDALRQGVVPERHLEMLLVGQEAARQHLLELTDYIATGRSAFKFIKGAYGAGKSFISAWLRDRALNAGFATAAVRISAELSLADLSNFYTGLMDGLRTPEKRGASSFSDLIETWLLEIQRKVEQIEGLSPLNNSDREKLTIAVKSRINDELSELADHDPGLAPALSAFYEARVTGDDERAMQARAWLRGERNLPTSALRNIGVRGYLEADQVLPRLRALLEIIGRTPLRGLVILVDELELVRRRPNRQSRDQAYETLRLLIDEVGENRLPGCLLVCTGTNTLFEDARYGLASYAALLHRIQAPEAGESHRSMRQPVIELDGLDETRLRQVALRTREIHAAAYSWPAMERVTDDDIEALVQEWIRFGGEAIDRLPRPTLRSLVHVLDLCEENPGIAARDCITEPERDPQANEALLRLMSGE